MNNEKPSLIFSAHILCERSLDETTVVPTTIVPGMLNGVKIYFYKF